MNVAWLTHHVARDSDASWLLPGGVGGAEMTDSAMIRQAPMNVRVDVIHPDDWESALGADRIIITGTDLLPDAAMIRLADESPMVWIHHQQQPSEARRELFSRAKPFITMSYAHSMVELGWSDVKSEWCHGDIDCDVEPSTKREAALWSARNHPQKGLLAARMWSRRTGIPLTELSSVARNTVMEAMAVHRYFVFLPQAFDSCPRTLIEAEHAGCEIVTNDNAGRRDPGPLAEVMAAQAPKFWGWL